MSGAARTSGRKPWVRAFSLTEVLVVLAIIVVLMALVVPTTQGPLESGRIAQAATILSSQLSIARQKAIAENRPIIVRFIRRDSTSSFDRIQLVASDPTGNLSPVERVAAFPVGTALSQSSELSSLIQATPETAATVKDPSVPGFGNSYRYVQFSFRPGGSLDLDITKLWFGTVLLLRCDSAIGETPANFVTYQIDPVNGSVSTFRR
ncbi:MAG: Verru_Chthon cassette protein D [Phycisphaerae bacterium]|jgi:uncharacterized protein (TIGR02596 family)